MKKRRLRKWVKVSLVAMILVCLLAINNVFTNNAIESCVNNGNSRTYCEAGLR